MGLGRAGASGPAGAAAVQEQTAQGVLDFQHLFSTVLRMTFLLINYSWMILGSEKNHEPKLR